MLHLHRGLVHMVHVVVLLFAKRNRISMIQGNFKKITLVKMKMLYPQICWNKAY